MSAEWERFQAHVDQASDWLSEAAGVGIALARDTTLTRTQLVAAVMGFVYAARPYSTPDQATMVAVALVDGVVATTAGRTAAV